MSDRIATVRYDNRVFIAIDTLRMGMDIIGLLPPEMHMKALQEVLDRMEVEGTT